MGILWSLARWLFGLLALFFVGYILAMSGYHSPPAASIARLAPDATPRTVMVIGATGALGRELVSVLRERGDNVVAMARASSDTAVIDGLGADKVVADALDAEQVMTAVGARPVDAIISALGTSATDLPERMNPIKAMIKGPPRMDPDKRPDFIGNRNVIEAARKHKIARFILVSVVGAGDSAEATPLAARKAHSAVVPLKTMAEDHLRGSGLQYTIIRPGGLGKQPATANAVLVEDPLAFSFISRSDLARLTVAALHDSTTVGKTYTAYDSDRRMLWQLFTAK
ncbi:MAG: SDR family oxidoreductase [Pseudomonadales bacterium]|nr:SDR family oxidoreductase [Pseudomonadales bacterium]